MLAPPPRLVELQKWFVRVEVAPLRETGELRLPKFDSELHSEIEGKISPGPKLSAVQRIGIYNQQFWFRFFTIMQGLYPTLLRLFGYRDFNFQLVEPYVLRHLPNHWSIRKVGDRFQEWIRDEYQEEDREFVLQIAEIEAGYEQLAEAATLPFDQKIDRTTRLFLQPWVVLLELDADLLSFREKILLEPPAYWEEHEFPQIDWFEQKKSFALFRKHGEICFEELTASESILLRSFKNGATVEEACGQMSEACQVSVSIGGWFQKWAARRWLAPA